MRIAARTWLWRIENIDGFGFSRVPRPRAGPLQASAISGPASTAFMPPALTRGAVAAVLSLRGPAGDDGLADHFASRPGRPSDLTSQNAGNLAPG
jgi:hypothetical protein